MLALALIWVGLVAFSLVQAVKEGRSGVAAIQAVRDSFELEDLESGRLQTALDEASADFVSAQAHVRAPWVSPLRLVPLIGRQIQSADALSSSAAATADSLRWNADRVVSIKEDAERGSTGRAEAARRSAVMARDLVATVESLELGPSSALLPPLAAARADFEAELAEMLDVMQRGEVAAAGVADFLTGPSHYLLLSANTAEMRAGTGMFLLAGVVDVVDGEITVGDLVSTGPLRLEEPVPIPDVDFADRWGWMQPDQEWRNLATSPRLPASAEVAAAMWEESMDDVVDGVLVVDPVALEALLEVSGPITVDGAEVSAATIVSLVAFDQYWETDADVRRQRLAALAAGSLAAVSDPTVDLFTLAAGLADAAAGRHLMAWSAEPEQQEAWAALEIDGDLSEDSVMVSVLNRGANKLDTFLDVAAQATSATREDAVHVDLAVTLSNRTGTGLPDYVLGPAETLGLEAGTYVGMLTVNLPGAAENIVWRDQDSLLVDGPDGPTEVRGVWVELPAGETSTYHVEFDLPVDAARLVIEPSARVPAIEWQFDEVSWIDRASRTIDLTEGDYGAEPSSGIFPGVDSIRSSQVAVPPTPRVQLSRADASTAVVSWRVVLTSADVVLWERIDAGQWEVASIGAADDSAVRSGLPAATPVCYRTALAAAPAVFSEPVCVSVPAPRPPSGYLEFTGDPESYLTADDFLSGSELDVRLLVAPDEWRPESWRMFVGQFDRAVDDRSWRFGIDSFESFRGNFSADGKEPVGDNRPIPDYFTDGLPEWIRLTIDTTTGLERFWVSEDGENWTQWGDDIRYEPFELHDSPGPVYIGTDRPLSDNAFSGRLYYLEVRRGISGDVVARLDLRTDVDEQDEGLIDEVGVVWNGQGPNWSYVSAAELAGP